MTSRPSGTGSDRFVFSSWASNDGRLGRNGHGASRLVGAAGSGSREDDNGRLLPCAPCCLVSICIFLHTRSSLLGVLWRSSLGRGPYCLLRFDIAYTQLTRHFNSLLFLLLVVLPTDLGNSSLSSPESAPQFVLRVLCSMFPSRLFSCCPLLLHRMMGLVISFRRGRGLNTG